MKTRTVILTLYSDRRRIRSTIRRSYSRKIRLAFRLLDSSPLPSFGMGTRLPLRPLHGPRPSHLQKSSIKTNRLVGMPIINSVHIMLSIKFKLQEQLLSTVERSKSLG